MRRDGGTRGQASSVSKSFKWLAAGETVTSPSPSKSASLRVWSPT